MGFLSSSPSDQQLAIGSKEPASITTAPENRSIEFVSDSFTGLSPPPLCFAILQECLGGFSEFSSATEQNIKSVAPTSTKSTEQLVISLAQCAPCSQKGPNRKSSDFLHSRRYLILVAVFIPCRALALPSFIEKNVQPAGGK